MRKRGKQFSTRRDPNSLVRALVGVHTMDKEQQVDLGLAYRFAFQSLRTGTGKEEDFHTLACALNIALVLAEMGFVGEAVDDIKAAQAGLIRCMSRSQRLQKWGLDGDAMTAIASALAVHDHQLTIVSQHNLELAIKEVHKRMSNGQVMEVV